MMVGGGGGEFLICSLLDGANGALPPARILDIAKALHQGAPRWAFTAHVPFICVCLCKALSACRSAAV